MGSNEIKLSHNMYEPRLTVRWKKYGNNEILLNLIYLTSLRF